MISLHVLLVALVLNLRSCHLCTHTIIPKSLSEDLPMCLSNLFKPEYLKCSYGELLKLARQCKISVSPEQVEMAERKTRCQSICSLWYQLRTGRITASNFKNASHTTFTFPTLPSNSKSSNPSGASTPCTSISMSTSSSCVACHMKSKELLACCPSTKPAILSLVYP